MVRVVCFSIDSLVESRLETIVFNVAIPLIIVVKNKTQFTIARGILKEKLRELSSRHASFYYSLETLATVLDLDYNLLVDLYEYLARNYVQRVEFSEEVLKGLHARGIKNIVFTKSDPTIDEIKLTSSGLRIHIDSLISLPEIFGMIKGREVFEKLKNHMIKQGYIQSADDLLIVSSNMDDYMDAMDAGLKAIWFSKHGEIRTHNQIMDLRELISLL